ncbi:hypothetical protein DL765_004625 [Monosporascus sp. GIB2]|nr:hypothetical protein DL765_004625 [Monosporascus sp. GIB2]
MGLPLSNCPSKTPKATTEPQTRSNNAAGEGRARTEAAFPDLSFVGIGRAMALPWGCRVQLDRRTGWPADGAVRHQPAGMATGWACRCREHFGSDGGLVGNIMLKIALEDDWRGSSAARCGSTPWSSGRQASSASGAPRVSGTFPDVVPGPPPLSEVMSRRLRREDAFHISSPDGSLY